MILSRLEEAADSAVQCGAQCLLWPNSRSGRRSDIASAPVGGAQLTQAVGGCRLHRAPAGALRRVELVLRRQHLPVARPRAVGCSRRSHRESSTWDVSADGGRPARCARRPGPRSAGPGPRAAESRAGATEAAAAAALPGERLGQRSWSWARVAICWSTVCGERLGVELGQGLAGADLVADASRRPTRRCRPSGRRSWPGACGSMVATPLSAALTFWVEATAVR